MYRRTVKERVVAWVCLVLGSALALALARCPAQSQEVQWEAWVREFEPTPLHEMVYEVMENCSGQEGQYNEVTWAVAPIIRYGPDKDRLASGAWDAQEETDSTEAYRIIVLQQERAFDARTISEEALHDIYNGIVPLDVANRCLLTWKALKFKEED